MSRMFGIKSFAHEVFGVAMVKDEIDVIERTVEHMLTQVDHLLIADNGSTDGTLEILKKYRHTGQVVLAIDSEIAYYQAEKMTELAAQAKSLGADWVVPFDADEIWQTTNGEPIKDVLNRLPGAIATARIYEYVPTSEDDLCSDPFCSINWRRPDHANPLKKIACKPSISVRIEQGNHGASYDGSYTDDQLIVRHFPYRTLDQFIKKIRNGAAAYAATDLHPSLGHHWREYGLLSDEELINVFNDKHYSINPKVDGLIYDSVSP